MIVSLQLHIFCSTSVTKWVPTALIRFENSVQSIAFHVQNLLTNSTLGPYTCLRVSLDVDFLPLSYAFLVIHTEKTKVVISALKIV